MTDRGRQDLAAVIADLKHVAATFEADGEQAERLLDGSVVSFTAARLFESFADRLALLLAEAPQDQDTKEDTDTRWADTQYGAPLATASENQTAPALFRKKPVVIAAVQWFPDAGIHHPGVYCDLEGPGRGRPYVVTIHGERAHLSDGDWILPEPDGKSYYPCKPDIFAATYEPLALLETRGVPQEEDQKDDQARGRTQADSPSRELPRQAQS